MGEEVAECLFLNQLFDKDIYKCIECLKQVVFVCGIDQNFQFLP